MILSTKTSFYIGVACSNHVQQAVNGGFAQLAHGSHSAVKNLRQGDWIAYYAPRVELDQNSDKVQAFVALGEVISTKAYQVEIPKPNNSDGGCFQPWRVDVEYVEYASPAKIQPLLNKLDLTRHRGPKKWGLAVRRSKIKATKHDFWIIAQAMGLSRSSVKLGYS